MLQSYITIQLNSISLITEDAMSYRLLDHLFLTQSTNQLTHYDHHDEYAYSFQPCLCIYNEHCMIELDSYNSNIT